MKIEYSEKEYLVTSRDVYANQRIPAIEHTGIYLDYDSDNL